MRCLFDYHEKLAINMIFIGSLLVWYIYSDIHVQYMYMLLLMNCYNFVQGVLLAKLLQC